MRSPLDVLFVDRQGRAVVGLEIKAGSARTAAWATELCDGYRERGFLAGLDWFCLLTPTVLFVWEHPNEVSSGSGPSLVYEVRNELAPYLTRLPREPGDAHWRWFEAAAVNWLQDVWGSEREPEGLRGTPLLRELRARELVYGAAA